MLPPRKSNALSNVPDEIEFETKAERIAKGIPIPGAVINDFVALGQKLGLPFPRP
jgi:hypothetical protein